MVVEELFSEDKEGPLPLATTLLPSCGISGLWGCWSCPEPPGEDKFRLGCDYKLGSWGQSQAWDLGVGRDQMREPFQN